MSLNRPFDFPKKSKVALEDFHLGVLDGEPFGTVHFRELLYFAGLTRGWSVNGAASAGSGADELRHRPGFMAEEFLANNADETTAAFASLSRA